MVVIWGVAEMAILGVLVGKDSSVMAMSGMLIWQNLSAMVILQMSKV